MKKRLLFVLPSLKSGGAEKSLVTLLRLMDYEKYDVDLLLFRKEGLFLPLLPKEVNVTDAGENYRLFDGGAGEAISSFARGGKIPLAINRYLYGRAQRLPEKERVKKSWKYLSSVLPLFSDCYDVAIAYLEGTSTYYVADCVNAVKKIAFLHTDYDRISEQKELDEKYYKKVDALVGVSETCCEKACGYFPFLSKRAVTVENIISPSLIKEMAKEECVLPDKGTAVSILTVGRMSPPKGIDTAVSACAILTEKGYDIKWYHIGTGELEGDIKKQIKELSMESRFILLNEQSNPYKYISRCDIYVQPSRFEGKSIAIDEAKCLARPIVVTNFDTVKDQITDGINGIVTEKDAQSVANGVERLITDKALRDKLCENLCNEKVGNEEEIERFYALL